ncbi:hypothetical protein BHE74_00059655 [Ensete ventricosum]|nr:hypothetical protein BHE74_00059655 [Ensete ventricosum]
MPLLALHMPASSLPIGVVLIGVAPASDNHGHGQLRLLAATPCCLAALVGGLAMTTAYGHPYKGPGRGWPPL